MPEWPHATPVSSLKTPRSPHARTGDRIYNAARLEHSQVSPDALKVLVSDVIDLLDCDAADRGFALDWNTAKIEIASVGFGNTPDHEARVTATVL